MRQRRALRRVSQKERPPKVTTTKIGIVIRSFDHPFLENPFWGLPPYTRKIGLPESRVLYTVLRSPHIDKKSREQFWMKIKKEFLVIKTERHELRKKFFWLKQRILRRLLKKVFLLGKHGTLIWLKSVPFLFVATVSSLLYLLCMLFNFPDFFHALLSKVGFSLGGRALSFPLRGLGCCCSAGLALTVGFALRALLTGEEFTHMMIPFGEGTSGASSSESPATPASPSDSLIGHASSETDSDKEQFFTPPQSVSSASSSSTSTPGIESAPNNGENEERYSFTYIKPGSAAHEAMKESLIRIARGRIEEWEASGKIDGLIRNEELAQALNLELVQTREEMERLAKELLGLDWAKFERAPAGASYAGISDLLTKHRRKTGWEE